MIIARSVGMLFVFFSVALLFLFSQIDDGQTTPTKSPGAVYATETYAMPPPVHPPHSTGTEELARADP